MYDIRVLLKNVTILARLIQQNQPHALYWLPFDMDWTGAPIDRSDRNCPASNITVKNPRNGHTYLLCTLAPPARITLDVPALALRYATAIERTLYEKLDAGVDYSGLIYKNPCRPEWQEVERREGPYTLDGLVDYLDLSASACRSVDKSYGLGRNYRLFEKIRRWAYRTIRQGWPVFSQRLDAMIQRVKMYNAPPPVPPSPAECRVIGESTTKYTYRRFSPEGFFAVQVA